MLTGAVTVVVQRTYVAKPGEVDCQWHVVDGTDAIVGRLASQIAVILMGKHRPTYTPHVDTGDFVIVTHADKIEFSGTKWNNKTYARYSGYPGHNSRARGQTTQASSGADPYRRRASHVAEKQTRPSRMLAKLKVYCGPDHPHQAQQPEVLTPPKLLSK